LPSVVSVVVMRNSSPSAAGITSLKATDDELAMVVHAPAARSKWSMAYLNCLGA